jgi:hypothetical protein
MARKSRKAARGRHNKARLRKLNDKLVAIGIAAQPSLTKAAQYRSKLRPATPLPANTNPEAKEAPEIFDERKKKHIERKRKQREQAKAAKEAKLQRSIQNKNIQQ